MVGEGNDLGDVGQQSSFFVIYCTLLELGALISLFEFNKERVKEEY